MKKRRRVSALLAAALAVLLLFAAPVSAAAGLPDGEHIRPMDDPAEILFGGDINDIEDPGLAEFISWCRDNGTTPGMRTSDLYIKHFDTELRITDDRAVEVTESIYVYFNEEMHGYQRWIPLYGAEERYRISGVRVTGAEYEVDEHDDNIHIRIGSEHKTVTGLRKYVISYTVEYMNDISTGYDRIYHDIMPTELEDYVSNATARVIMPEGAQLLDYTLYSGSYGSTDSEWESYYYDGVLYAYASERLKPYSGATVDLKFPEGMFVEKPADVTVETCNVDFVLQNNGEFRYVQTMTVSVDPESRKPVLPVSFRMSSGENLGRSNAWDKGDKACPTVTTITLDGETVYEEGGGFYGTEDDLIEVDLSRLAGKRGKLVVARSGYWQAATYPRSFEMCVRPMGYEPGYFHEYKDIDINVMLPGVAGDADGVSYEVYTGNQSKDYGFTHKAGKSGFTAKLNGHLPSGETVAFSVKLPEGVVEREYGAVDFIAIGAAALIGLITVIFIFLRKRRAVVPTMEFYPPDGLNPAEVGYIIDTTADNKDLTSLIYYWASKGYLTIEVLDKNTYTLRKLKDLAPGHRDYEHLMFNKLWALGSQNTVTSTMDSIRERLGLAYANGAQTQNGGNGQMPTVFSSQLNEHYYDTLAKACSQLKAEFKGAAMRIHDKASEDRSLLLLGLAAIAASILPFILLIFAKTYTGSEPIAIIPTLLVLVPAYLLSVRANKLRVKKGSSAVLMVISVILALLGGIVYAAMIFAAMIDLLPAWLLGMSLSLAVIISPWLKVYSPYGASILGRCIGFKNFLKTAEKDRLEMLLEKDPDYYYDILPYAQVLGVSDIWESRFAGLELPTPTWFYGPSITPMTARILMMQNMSRMSRTMSSVPVQSSGGGRFGGFSGGGGFGGGFSGGGGGGGGGGGW